MLSRFTEGLSESDFGEDLSELRIASIFERLSADLLGVGFLAFLIAF